MAFAEVCGTLLRAGASEASGGFGHVGHGGHDGGIGSERRSVGSFVRRPQADVCLARERWPVASHCCDPGMKRALMACKKSAAPVPMKPTPLPGPTHASPPQHAQHTTSQLTPSPPMHSPSRARSSPARPMPAPPSPSFLRRRLGTWHALALGTPWHLARASWPWCESSRVRSWRASPGSVAGACVIRFVVVAADRPGALALGTPWHLARLGTWHVFVVIVLPWIMPARLVFSSCVLAARARRACPSAPVCQTRLSLGGRPGTWLDLALGTRVEQFLHRCFAGTHALQHTLGRCMWCCGLVPIPARAGMGWIPPLNGCSQGLVVSRGVAPCTLSYICHTKVFSKVSNSLPIHQYFPTASPYGARSQADG